MFLFDTDHLGIIQQRTAPECDRILQRMQGFAEDEFFVSIVSFHEQVMGWNAYLSRARNATGVMRAYERFQQILTDFSTAQVASFDRRASDQFDQLRLQRVRIGTMDLRIASIGLAHDMTVLTRNLSDFARVPGLKVEDWST